MAYLCPVCKAEVIVDYSDCVEGTLCESCDHCPNGCCESQFAYGSYYERIGEYQWNWYYTESTEDERNRRRERKWAIEQAREVMRHRPLINWLTFGF